MTQELGDELAMSVLHAHDTIVRAALEQHGGREVKHTGDGIMASFASVAGSVRCSIDIQQGIAEQNKTDTNYSFQVKIGLYRNK